MAGPCRQLPAHDVLHHRGRLDARLRGEKRLRRVRGAGKFPGGRRLQWPARRPGAACRVHVHHRGRGCGRHARRRAEGRGARDEGHDDGPVRGACGPVRARGHAAGRGRGPALLSDARFQQDVRRRHAGRAAGNVRRCRVRGHGPGVLHRLGRHGRHVYLRQLHRTTRSRARRCAWPASIRSWR